MGLGGSTISTWDDMRTTFLEKYQDYYKSRNIKEELSSSCKKKTRVWKIVWNDSSTPYRVWVTLTWIRKF
jgi:hypothetical protein